MRHHLMHCLLRSVCSNTLSYYGNFKAESFGWSGVAKVSCILCNWGVQLRLAYSWAMPAVLVAG